MNATALVSIPVGVVVERLAATSPWLDYIWRPASVLVGVPSAAPWTPLESDGETTTFYAGASTIDFYRTETDNYLSNLTSGAPMLWVVLRSTDQAPPFEVVAVTADPAEGEAFTEAGNDIVDTLPMPQAVIEALEAFIHEHHVERPFFKRSRDSVADHQSGRRRGGRGRDE